MSVKSTITLLLLSTVSLLSSGCVDEEDKFLRENLRDSRWMYILSIKDHYFYLYDDQTKEIISEKNPNSSFYAFNNFDPPIYENTPPPPLTFYESVKTLICIDRDQDGIRDDFERYANYRYGKEPSTRELLHDYNRLWQKMLEEYFVKQNTFFPSLYDKFYRMRRCIFAHHIVGYKEEEFMFNTKMRYKAFLDITHTHWKKMEQDLAKYDITSGDRKSKLLCPENFLYRFTIPLHESERLNNLARGKRK